MAPPPYKGSPLRPPHAQRRAPSPPTHPPTWSPYGRGVRGAFKSPVAPIPAHVTLLGGGAAAARVPAKSGGFGARAPQAPGARERHRGRHRDTGNGTGAMAQLRLTDFFGRAKAAATVPAKRVGGPRLKGAPVHREAEDGAPLPPPPLPASPRTPSRGAVPAVPGLAGRKRSRREMEAELGTGTGTGERGGKSARKRLELPAVRGGHGRGVAASPVCPHGTPSVRPGGSRGGSPHGP